MTDLEHMLKTLEYEEEDKKEVTRSVCTLRRLMTIKQKTLEQELGLLADELLEAK